MNIMILCLHNQCRYHLYFLYAPRHFWNNRNAKLSLVRLHCILSWCDGGFGCSKYLLASYKISVAFLWWVLAYCSLDLVQSCLRNWMWLKKNLFPNDECRDHVANIYSMKWLKVMNCAVLTFRKKLSNRYLRREKYILFLEIKLLGMLSDFNHNFCIPYIDADLLSFCGNSLYMPWEKSTGEHLQLMLHQIHYLQH
jgi:hypothetical protein